MQEWQQLLQSPPSPPPLPGEPTLQKRIRGVKAALKAARAKPADRPEELEAQLTGLELEKGAVLRLVLQDGEVPIPAGQRIAIALPAAEKEALLEAFAGRAEGVIIAQPQLRTAALLKGDEQEWALLAVAPPHAICLSAELLSHPLLSVLRRFDGALVILEPGQEAEDEEMLWFHALRLRHRFASGRVVAAPKLKPEVIGDLKMRDAEAHHFAAASALCAAEFQDDLGEILQNEGIKLCLLVEGRRFYGFFLYKFWCPPLKALSIPRIAVEPKYQLLGFGRLMVSWAIQKAKQKPRHAGLVAM
ncbi:unnamed protein product [Effrenium voratum]|nr:unnamed protein product [Effrenium voratum]